MRPSGYSSFAADDPDVVAGVRAVLQRLEPALARDDVGVEQHDVARRGGGREAPVGVAREAHVRLAEDRLSMPVDRTQRSDVRGVRRRVVRDHDLDERRATSCGGCCARPPRRTTGRRRSGSRRSPAGPSREYHDTARRCWASTSVPSFSRWRSGVKRIGKVRIRHSDLARAEVLPRQRDPAAQVRERAARHRGDGRVGRGCLGVGRW